MHEDLAYVVDHIYVPSAQIHSPIPSHAGTATGCSSVPLSQPTVSGFDAIRSILYGNRIAGVYASVFSDHVDEVFQLLDAHGLQVSLLLPLREMRIKFLQHLIHGDYYMYSHNSDASTVCSRFGCHAVSRGHQSAVDISHSVLRQVELSCANNISTQDLIMLVESSGLCGPFHNTKNLRQKLVSSLRQYVSNLIVTTDIQRALPRHFDPLNDLFHGFEHMSVGALSAVAERHGIVVPINRKRTAPGRKYLRELIVNHTTDGSCLRRGHEACDEIAESVVSEDEQYMVHESEKISLYKSLKYTLPRSLLLSLLASENIDHDSSGNLASLRHSLQNHICHLERSQCKAQSGAGEDEELLRLRSFAIDNWPQPVSPDLKEKIIGLFQEATSSSTLAKGVCGSCAESIKQSDMQYIDKNDIDFSYLSRPDYARNNNEAEHDPFWLQYVGTGMKVPNHPEFLRILLSIQMLFSMIKKLMLLLFPCVRIVISI